jgi:hypothetical protein
MKHKLRILVLFIISLILAYIVAPYSGRLFELITGHRIPGGWIGSCPECYEGFFIAFAFFASTLMFAFMDRNRVKVALPFIVVAPVLLLFLGLGDVFLVALGFGLVGLGLGQFIYLTGKKYIKKNAK